METYFTFPDATLAYDCPSCRQRCCRGKGFALGAAELVPLLARAPAVAAHLLVRPGGSFGAVDLTDACWFLDGAGSCALETEHGRAAKPSTCRLFPFNRVHRVGEVRVVDVNTLLCPIEVAAEASRAVRHADLLAEIDELAPLAPALLDTPAPAPPGLPADWLTVERAAAADAHRHAASPDALAAATGEPDGARLVAEWARVHGVAPEELARLEAAVAPRVALLAPSLRWNRLFRRDAAPYPAVAPRLGRRLRALVFAGALAARLRPGTPSLRALTELWQAESSLLDVLERWTDPVKLAAPRFDADVAPELLPGLGALLAGAFRGASSLGALVAATAAALPPPLRPLAVALAAARLPTLLGAAVASAPR